MAKKTFSRIDEGKHRTQEMSAAIAGGAVLVERGQRYIPVYSDDPEFEFKTADIVVARYYAGHAV